MLCVGRRFSTQRPQAIVFFLIEWSFFCPPKKNTMVSVPLHFWLLLSWRDWVRAFYFHVRYTITTGTKAVSLHIFSLLLFPALHGRSAFPSAGNNSKKKCYVRGAPIIFLVNSLAPFGCQFLLEKKQFHTQYFGGCLKNKNQNRFY